MRVIYIGSSGLANVVGASSSLVSRSIVSLAVRGYRCVSGAARMSLRTRVTPGVVRAICSARSAIACV